MEIANVTKAATFKIFLLTKFIKTQLLFLWQTFF